MKFRHLDLYPEVFVDPIGKPRRKKNLHRWGTDRCFKQTDLYTTRFGSIENTDIERFFFGKVDNDGRNAIEYFANFTHPSANGEAFRALLNYMSIQKLRTPKGLSYLADLVKINSKDRVLIELQRLQNLHCAIWAEAVWAVVDATDASTKFMISDHPITVYNEDCFPGSASCQGFRDPHIWQTGTHTIFPLNMNKALILTNLAWVRNPYGKATNLRPNPKPLRSAMFKFTSIQTGRKLEDVEVNQINFIIKKKAYRYIAAASEEWLYPERHIPSNHWRKINERYLLMPDPRSVSFSGELIIGYKNGRSEAFDEYGYRPYQNRFSDKQRSDKEWKTFHAFQGEYSRLFGPKRRGITFELGGRTEKTDSEDFHKYHLGLEKKFMAAHLKPCKDRRAK